MGCKKIIIEGSASSPSLNAVNHWTFPPFLATYIKCPSVPHTEVLDRACFPVDDVLWMIGFVSCDALDSGDQVVMAIRLTHSNKLDAGDGAGDWPCVYPHSGPFECHDRPFFPQQADRTLEKPAALG